MTKRTSISACLHLKVLVRLGLLLMSMPLTAHAELCPGFLTYHPYVGLGDGSNNIAIVCDIQGTNDCTLTFGICRSGLQFTPAPPTHERICYSGFEETGYRCVPHRVYPTVTFYVGVPYCTPTEGTPTCDAGCTDWDTETTSSSTDYSWAEDSVEECPLG